MKVVVAMDSFKGCLKAQEACQAVAEGVQESLGCECVTLPLSDGGEGMLDVLDLKEYNITAIPVSGPLPSLQVNAKIAINQAMRTAIIESSQACGLSLLDETDRNPLNTSTQGVGEMISYAISQGCVNITIGLGGSATNDAGTGMIHALGVKFLDEYNNLVIPTGGNIDKITRLEGLTDLYELTKGINFVAACDVTNPLCGDNGASYVYAAQKGASKEDIRTLDSNLNHFSNIVNTHTGNHFENHPGSGAAGGLGYALMTFLNAKLLSGASIILDIMHFKDALKGCCHAITGEGQSDRQTLMGKLPFTVMTLAHENGVKTSIISGKSIDTDELLNAGFFSVNSATPSSMPLEQALVKEVAMRNLKECAKTLATQIS